MPVWPARSDSLLKVTTTQLNGVVLAAPLPAPAALLDHMSTMVKGSVFVAAIVLLSTVNVEKPAPNVVPPAPVDQLMLFPTAVEEIATVVVPDATRNIAPGESIISAVASA